MSTKTIQLTDANTFDKVEIDASLVVFIGSGIGNSTVALADGRELLCDEEPFDIAEQVFVITGRRVDAN